MYCSENTVRLLAKNRKSALNLGEIEAAAAVVDPQIDAALSTRFNWPGIFAQSEPPALIRAIANYLTAALIESQAYAQNEAGLATANPYGRYLERTGLKLLNEVVEGVKQIPDLTADNPVRGTSSASSSTFEPVTGFPQARQATRGRRAWA